MAIDPLPVGELATSLRRLGVADRDVVMVHASLRSLGPVEDGAAGVVRALDAAVGLSGTLVMMIGARDDWASVNEHPESERPGRLVDAEAFDCHTTPADPDVGVLAEVFRQTPGTVVSDHPEGRFAARGRLAREFVQDVPWDDYYGPGSPLQRLVEAQGRVLRLGADPNTVTLIHYAEYLADVPQKRRVRRHRLVACPTGVLVRTVECLDDSAGIVEFPGDDYFSVILAEHLDAFAPPRGVVGRAPCELIDAGDLVRFATRWMTDHFRNRVT